MILENYIGEVWGKAGVWVPSMVASTQNGTAFPIWSEILTTSRRICGQVTRQAYSLVRTQWALCREGQVDSLMCWQCLAQQIHSEVCFIQGQPWGPERKSSFLKPTHVLSLLESEMKKTSILARWFQLPNGICYFQLMQECICFPLNL